MKYYVYDVHICFQQPLITCENENDEIKSKGHQLTLFNIYSLGDRDGDAD